MQQSDRKRRLTVFLCMILFLNSVLSVDMTAFAANLQTEETKEFADDAAVQETEGEGNESTGGENETLQKDVLQEDGEENENILAEGDEDESEIESAETNQNIENSEEEVIENGFGDISLYNTGNDLSSFSFSIADVRDPANVVTFNGADGKQAIILYGRVGTCFNTNTALEALATLVDMADMENLNIYAFDVNPKDDAALIQNAANVSERIIVSNVNDSSEIYSFYRTCLSTTVGNSFALPLIIYKGTDGTIYQYTTGTEGMYYEAIEENVKAGGLQVTEIPKQTLNITGEAVYDQAYQVLERVNKERVAAGVPVLTMDSELLDAAMLRAAECSLYYSHTRPNGSGCFTASSKMSGENIAIMYKDAEAVMDGWMNSEGHKANILNSSYQSIGIGCFYIDGVYSWVQAFGMTAASGSGDIKSNQQTTYSVKALQEYVVCNLAFSNGQLRVGETKQLLVDAKATNRFYYVSVNADSYIWESDNPTVAEVDSMGLITAKGTGNAIITGYNISDASAVLTYELTVGEQGTSNPVTSIELNKNTLSMEALESETLQAEVFPATAENKELAWRSSNEEVASVDEKGRVSARVKGTAEITVAAQDGSGVSASCMVTVTNNAYICSSVEELESVHDYPDNCSDFWVYTKEGAQTLYLTFDDRTELEDGRDYLYVYDNKGTEIGKYTGKQLAGQSIEVSGDSVKIKLVSDNVGTAWGFKVTSVRGNGDAENNEYLVTFDSQGGTPISAVIVTKGAAVEEPEPPIKKNYSFLGWYLDGNQYDFTKPVTKNIVLKAKWQRILEEDLLDNSEEIPEEDVPVSGIIPNGLWIAGVTDQTYTGKALTPEVRVYDGSRRLKAGMDYTVSYQRNTKANDASDAGKAPTVTVKGKGNYSGSASAAFKINPVDLNDTVISVMDITLAYNGKQLKKIPTVTFNGKKLSAGKDFTVSYPSTGSGAYQQIGEYAVKLEGTGNFTGTRTVKLEITDKALIEKVKVVKIKDQTYQNGKEIILSKSDLIVYTKSKDIPLTEGVDYTLRYEDNKEIGTASVFITGMGGYAGTKKVTFKIVGTPLSKAVVENMENKVYNGEEQRQNIKLMLNGIQLKEDRDYTVTYEKNINVGTARMTVQGCGAYSGTIKRTFKITAYDLEKDENHLLTGLEAEWTVPYAKGGCKPVPALKFGARTLLSGTDYRISYINNKKPADRTAQKAPVVKIQGRGNFKGTVSIPFTIVKKNLADAENPVSVMVADVGYVKGAGKYISKPVLTDTDGRVLKAGTDYEVTYTLADGITQLDKKSSVNAGNDVCVTVKGKGNYEGMLMTTYRITENSFTQAKITVKPQVYTGKKIYLKKDDLKVTVKSSLGTTALTYGADYEIIEDSYVNNLKKGTASVKIRGLGKYGGTKTVKFKIQAKRMEVFDSIVRKSKEALRFSLQ